MKLEDPEVRPEERTPLLEAMLDLRRHVLDRGAQLEEAKQPLCDENARLQGHKPRPASRPGVLQQSPGPSPPPRGGKRPGSARRPKTAAWTLHHEQRLHPPELPPATTFRCFEPAVVQALLLRSDHTRLQGRRGPQRL